MDILEHIIGSLTSDEVRRFKILSNRFKADEEKKMLILFDEIRSGDFKAREDEFIEQIYGEVGARTKNSYYRLRNKLLSNLEKSLLFYHFNYKNQVEAYSFIQLALLMQERGLYREAYHHLKKAEKAARTQEQFSVLDVIYDHMVRLAPFVEVEITSVIERRRANRHRLEVLRANSEILGMVTIELSRHNYARNKRSSTVIETLEQIKEHLEEHEAAFNSAEGRLMVMQTVMSILVQKGAYSELADYGRRTFQELEEAGIFNRENHPQRLRLKIFHINSLQKLLRLEEARLLIDELAEDLKAYQGAHYRDFAYHYYSNLAFNLKLQGELETAEGYLLDALGQADILNKEADSELFLLISLADLYFLDESYDQATDAIRRVIDHPKLSSLSEEIQMYAHTFLLLNLYESGEHAKVEPEYRRMRKRFRHALKDDDYAHLQRFLDLLIRQVNATIEGKGMHLKAAHRNYLKEFGPGEIGDNRIIQYDLYLQSKVEERPYYDLLKAQVAQVVT